MSFISRGAFGVAMAASLVTVTIATAGELVSPPNDFDWQSATATLALRCAVVNAGKRDLTITIEVKDIGGNTLSGVTSGPISPGATLFAEALANGGDDLPRYCAFSTQGSVRALRASACVFEYGIGCISTVAAW